uniref:FAD-binding PCMH-type domain-containing protein n=1 Tax=Odontella aurita TaxID=265563 RepID=A0A7S4MTA8_9STRA|mmetsp:Transcript_31447/g.94074  ORF Transcript_31447/g.94074 Transcript_31447/m.94074 type:complete len:476 (+) Transcript_31447:137-1564(+)|eukprot:CAMPEP_0113576566 /NCGR_PEP_ID=MMETSP0015_2-20120614/28367_1 /TAXON_ID=2838 /ORGANISM="Odontella" /LENGTH=475 /DNA_ID=CAMNT_0000480015 /DNA_START=72 /DNA_END=1499 /DNA_ORIENTATION=+ /assembly_acc=CAM_ASM_000160
MSTDWFKDKIWSISVNKEAALRECKRSASSAVVYPKSAQDISELLASNQEAAVAVVCGGHSSSNVAAWAYVEDGGEDNAIILDMKNMASVTVDKEASEITVGGGSNFRQLAEVCKEAGGALPIGTGDTVGVCGFTVNGGLSGYFGKRLGMLGQRVVNMEIVLANGSVKNLTPASKGDDGDLFYACLGAGSAMGVVTSLTFKMDAATSLSTGGSIVVACGNKASTKPFLRRALQYMKESVLSTPSCSMEIVIVSDYTVIINFMFYDTFTEEASSFVQQVRDDAQACNVPIVADDVTSHKTWFDAASSLWDVIAGLKGDPLVRADHCIGTRTLPSDEVLDFVVDTWVGDYLEKALLSLVEIRSLGGAAMEGMKLPSGNANAIFFADTIVCYDGSSVSPQDKSSIMQEVHQVIVDARNQSELMVDFSGTHSQSDDPSELLPCGDEIFGGHDNYLTIKKVKQTFDSTNRFRFHPFVHLL